VSRRTLLRTTAGAAVGASAMSTALAQASTGNAGFYVNRNQDAGEITIYTWYQNWVDAVVPLFEEETGIKVNQIGTYSANDEWWARLNAGETFDFFMPTTDWVERAMKADLLLPLEMDQVTNLEHIEEDYQQHEIYQKDGNTYAVPFTRVYYSLTYNTNEFAEAPTSWAVTWDEAYKGKITMQDNALARIGTTALYLGDDPFNPTKWDEIQDKLLEQKELVTKYWKDYQLGMEMFINEEAVVGQLSDGRTRMGASLGGPMAWTVPEEGCLLEIDTFAIPRSAENPEGGLKFLNFLHQPDIIQMEMETMGYDTVNATAHSQLDPELESGFAAPEGSKTSLTRDLDPQIRSRIEEMWTEVQLS
jgi:spermidine/putrescine transport system substrate-binding protein